MKIFTTSSTKRGWMKMWKQLLNKSSVTKYYQLGNLLQLILSLPFLNAVFDGHKNISKDVIRKQQQTDSKTDLFDYGTETFIDFLLKKK